jgi:hypothetical protein
MIQEKKMANGTRWLLWGWLIVVLFLDVVPLGNELNQDLTTIRFVFRLDYLLHSLSFLVFALIWVLGKIKSVCWFETYEVSKFGGIVFVSDISIELLQIFFILYKKFNPIKMIANIVSSGLEMLFICTIYLEHRSKRRNRERKEVINL